jgi:flagellar L-ring protein precursor FlgH
MIRRKTNHLVCILTIGCCVLAADVASAQVPSLWQRRDDRMSNLVSDVKARRAGDLLFVTINEQSDVQNKDKRTLKKDSSSSSDANFAYGLSGGFGSGTGTIGFDQDSAASRAFNGDTAYKSEREFLDRFTVMVVDTLPNGNLLISGERSVGLEGDNRKLVLSGVVRSVDVSRDNVVSSQMVSNLRIRYEADQGAEKSFINQGWLGRKFNRLWPH